MRVRRKPIDRPVLEARQWFPGAQLPLVQDTPLGGHLVTTGIDVWVDPGMWVLYDADGEFAVLLSDEWFRGEYEEVKE